MYLHNGYAYTEVSKSSKIKQNIQKLNGKLVKYNLVVDKSFNLA